MAWGIVGREKGTVTFARASRRVASSAVFAEKYQARGMTVGDVDNDGRFDVPVDNNGQAPVLLRNRWGAGHHWIVLKLVGRKGTLGEGTGLSPLRPRR